MSGAKIVPISTADKYFILTGSIPCNGAGCEDFWPYESKQAVNQAYEKYLKGAY